MAATVPLVQVAILPCAPTWSRTKFRRLKVYYITTNVLRAIEYLFIPIKLLTCSLLILKIKTLRLHRLLYLNCRMCTNRTSPRMSKIRMLPSQPTLEFPQLQYLSTVSLLSYLNETSKQWVLQRHRVNYF